MAYEARTQAYTIQLRHCHPQRGLYLRWLSALGNWEGWLFSGHTDSKLGLEGATSWAPGEDGTQQAIARPGQETVTVRAGNLSQAQYLALRTILTSPQVYLQAETGELTSVLVAENATAASSSIEGKHLLALEIQLPKENALSN